MLRDFQLNELSKHSNKKPKFNLLDVNVRYFEDSFDYDHNQNNSDHLNKYVKF